MTGVQLTRPISWTKKIHHGLLNTVKAHLAEVMELISVGAWQSTGGNPIYARAVLLLPRHLRMAAAGFVGGVKPPYLTYSQGHRSG